jgi:maleate isomerase
MSHEIGWLIDYVQRRRSVLNLNIAALPVPGSLGRLGIIQPAPGLMLEAEWATATPPGVAFPVTRLALGGTTHADYARMAEEAPGAVAILANAKADVIGYACGIGSLHEGPEAERRLMESLSVAAGGIPVIGMAQAAVLEMQRHGARRVSVLTPYAASVNELVRLYLEATGFIVTGIFALPVDGAIAAAGLHPEQTIAAACEALGSVPTDILWIPCSNVRSFGLTDRIAALAGRPCISSNQAMLAVMLARLAAIRRPS